MWLAFAASVALLLITDLIANRDERAETRGRALRWTVAFVGAGLLFGCFVWLALGGRAAQEYVAAWLLELSLSIDNLFVFLLIFQSLAVPRRFQRRVLFWGVLGAIGFRAVFIVAGAAALERWSWLLWVFSVTLLYAAWRALRQNPDESRHSRMADWLAGRFPVTPQIQGDRFVACVQGRRVATPLLLALTAIELTDIVFAMDSIPAALSVSRNVFVIYSANIMAVLGMRALYLLLADTIAEMRYLHYALAAILAFTAFKLGLERWISIPPFVSVGFIVAALVAAVVPSLRARTSDQQRIGSDT